ncbi:phage major capsid protein [Paenibacillus taichungensis]|uniref:phage major capsid protein n=1 Tax=Paenibacillus taichungensis TaxID=484184 RepID=UPI002DB9D0B1|nr:phage major capsid protein [Paenibacillus taichungensis]MEC0107263.1 phage major capsid protein [Paenibacillus taichungensis]MEC0194805.1 phage major capsid protein [Paenibacillus taichungensis]
MNKKKLKAMLAKLEEKKESLLKRSGTTGDIAELRSINTEMDELNVQIAEMRGIIDAMPEDDEPVAGGATPPEQRGAQVPGGGNAGMAQVLSSFGMNQNQRSAQPSDHFATMEYRQAFMAFAVRGEIKPELRADASTTTADVSAVIPTTILNEVIKKLEVRGRVWSRVRKLNIKGGVEVPLLSVKPVATWITEAKSSDRQKVQAKDKVSFSYFGLECKVAVSLLADTVTLEGFETLVIDLIVEAMIKALEAAVVSGSGSGAPLGITNDSRVPATQIVTLDQTEILQYQPWKKKVFAKMPLAYKAGAVFFMASGTFETYVDGMVDDVGQPIGRVNYGITNGIQERFGGKEVILVEDDLIQSYDMAAEGDVVAIFCDLTNYGVNSNMQLTMFRYFDHDTNEWVDKAILIADGKLLDPNGVVIIKKGAAGSGT